MRYLLKPDMNSHSEDSISVKEYKNDRRKMVKAIKNDDQKSLRDVRCNYCSIKFKNKRSLDSHTSKFHSKSGNHTEASYTARNKSEVDQNNSMDSQSQTSERNGKASTSSESLETMDDQHYSDRVLSKREKSTNKHSKKCFPKHKGFTCKMCKSKFLTRKKQSHGATPHDLAQNKDKKSSGGKGYVSTSKRKADNSIGTQTQLQKSPRRQSSRSSSEENDNISNSADESQRLSSNSSFKERHMDNKNQRKDIHRNTNSFNFKDVDNFKRFFKQPGSKKVANLDQYESSLVECIMLIENKSVVKKLMDVNPIVINSIFEKMGIHGGME